jgi:hypothetical protein
MFRQVEEDLEDVLIPVFFISERPSCFNDRAISLDRSGLVFGIELKSCVGREYLLE